MVEIPRWSGRVFWAGLLGLGLALAPGCSRAPEPPPLSVLTQPTSPSEEPQDAFGATPADPGVASREKESRIALPPAGRTIYIDPETGRLTSQPPDKATALRLADEFARSISTSHDEVEIVTMPDGMKVASRPRGFRTAVMATVDKDGDVTVRDVAPPSAARRSKDDPRDERPGEGGNR